jgi:hypothetical protein
MTLTSLVLAALLALVRPSTHWAPVPPEQIAVIADDIALAASLHDGAPFTGPKRVQKHALALAAIAVHESNLAEKVVSCRYAGDPLRGWKPGRGLSVSHFQLHKGAAWFGHTRKEICDNGALSAYLAGKVLRNHSRAQTALALFQGYASGDASRPSRASMRQCAMWAKIMSAAKITGSCWSRP